MYVGCLFIAALAVGAAANEIIVVDPGHGGPGGGKYGSNGDGYGTEGPNGLSEEWVNLQVGLKLDSLINNWWWDWATSVLTRSFDTQFVSLARRVQRAKDESATYLISIHHNGAASPTIQGSEVFWSDSGMAIWTTDTLTDSSFYRLPDSRDSLLAKKLLLKLRETWNYSDRCRVRNQGNWMRGCDESQSYVSPLFVLNHTHHCHCALSEASFITTYSEESLFADELSGHADQEATALHTGAHSHHYNMGIAQIANAFIGGPGEQVAVDEFTFETPIEFTWEPTEWHVLVAWQNFYFDDYVYTFHHWAHLDPREELPLEEHYNHAWDINIWYEEGFHIYRAYFTGGPYEVSLFYLPYPLLYEIGEIIPIYWSCDPGVDSSSRVSIYLDRHGGNGGFPETIAASVPFEEGCHWTVTGPVSDSCLFKIVAEDVAGNVAEEVEEDMFTVSTCSWLVGDATGDEIINIIDATFIIAYVFSGGPSPDPLYSGDADCNGIVNLSDAVSLIAYIFGGAPAPPCSCADYESPKRMSESVVSQ